MTLTRPLCRPVTRPIARAVSGVGVGGLQEVLLNGDFSDGSANWTVSGQDGTHIATFSNGTLRYQSGTTTPQLLVQQLGRLTIGKTYLVTVETSAYVSGQLKSDSFSPAPIISNALGTKTFTAVAVSTSFQMTRSTTNVDLTLTKVSAKEYP